MPLENEFRRQGCGGRTAFQSGAGKGDSPWPLIVGNWKMYGLKADLDQARALALAVGGTRATVVLCPPATLVERMARRLAGTPIAVGGQDCHMEPAGAHTGDISALMLSDAGATYVIVGHSERRAAYAETDATVAAKAEAAIEAGLTPIICVGESAADHAGGGTAAGLRRQVASSAPAALADKPCAIAYEPLWAMATGATPSGPEIECAHGAIRAELVRRFGVSGEKIPILYGGSVGVANAAAIVERAGVGGLLVGRASRTSADFLRIVESATRRVGRPRDGAC